MRQPIRLPLVFFLGALLLAGAGMLWVGLGSGADGHVGVTDPLGPGDALMVTSSASDPSVPAVELSAVTHTDETVGAGPAAPTERRAIAPVRASGPDGIAEYAAFLTAEDAATGRPIEGVTVRELILAGEPLASHESWRSTVSGPSGAFEVVARLPGSLADDGSFVSERRFDVRIEAPGYVSVVAGDVRAQLDEGVDGGDGAAPVAPPARRVLVLERAAGLVLDVYGAPLARPGELALWHRMSPKDREPDLSLTWPIQAGTSPQPTVPGAVGAAGAGAAGEPSLVRVETGSAGSVRVTLEGLPPGALTVALAVEGAPVVLEQSLVLTPGERLQHELEVKAGEVANGVILDVATKQPVAGVQVQMVPALEGLVKRLDRLPYPPQVSDSRGAFSIPGLPLGDIGVELVTVDGLRHPRQISVHPGNLARSHRIHVRGPAGLTGRVILAEGTSAEGLQVLVTTAEAGSRVRVVDGEFKLDEKFGPGAWGTVDPRTGEFTVESVPSGRRLVVHAQGAHTTHGQVRTSKIALGEQLEGVEVPVSSRREVLFRVVLTNGQPVTTVRARFHGKLQADGGVAGKASRRRWVPTVTLEARPDGLFACAAAVVEIARVRLHVDGGATGVFDWPNGAADEIPTFELVLPPAIDFKVTGSDGLAIAGATVRASESEEATHPSKRKKGPAARTDEYGRAHLIMPLSDSENAGVFTEVRVSAAGYLTQRGIAIGPSDEAPAPPREIVLERALPPERAMVTGRLVRANGEALRAPRFDGLRGGTAHVDEHSFELRGIRPGRTRIIIHCERFESIALPAVTLRPGERLDIGEHIMRWATRLDVVVKDSKGRPVKESQVRLARLSPKQGGRRDVPRLLEFPRKSQGKGRFRRSNVPRTKWRLVVNHPGHQPFRKIVSVSGASKTIEVALKAKP